VASSTLVRPEEADPQISLRHPRGSPPVSASISRMPLEIISGEGRTARREAGVTPASFGTVASCFRTHAASLSKTATGWPPATCEQTNGEDNFDLRNFRERDFAGASEGCLEADIFAFYSPKRLCLCGISFVKLVYLIIIICVFSNLR
jgi:hypothetical protein